MDETAISVNGLSKQYRLKSEGRESQLNTVLHDLNFTVKSGERWGIIGKNGSGKSTLLKILSGIVKPTSGSAALLGSVAHILSVGDNFIPDLSGVENVNIFLRLHGFSRKKADEALPQVREFAEIGDYIYAPVKTYSDGMYLRLAFAACLQLSANILLIDEVFSAGDAAFQEKLKKHFKNIFTTAETLVMVSHNPEEIISYCTHCAWLEQGKIKMLGTAKEVESAYYYDLSKENWERNYNNPLAQNANMLKMSFVPVENEYLKVSGFSVTAPEGAEVISYDSGVKFIITIEKKQPGLVLHAAIRIYDYLMNMIVMLLPQADSAADLNLKMHENTVGKMQFETLLQPQLLTFGNYYAELIFSKNVSLDKGFLEEAIKVPTKVHFEVKPGLIYDYAGGTDNICIKPQCDWAITQLV